MYIKTIIRTYSSVALEQFAAKFVSPEGCIGGALQATDSARKRRSKTDDNTPYTDYLLHISSHLPRLPSSPFDSPLIDSKPTHWLAENIKNKKKKRGTRGVRHGTWIGMRFDRSLITAGSVRPDQWKAYVASTTWWWDMGRENPCLQLSLVCVYTYVCIRVYTCVYVSVFVCAFVRRHGLL